MNDAKIIRAGGWSLVLFTILYLGIQVFLMVNYDYPAVLHGPDREVLPILLSGGLPLAVILTIFAFTPLLLIPGSLGAYYAFRNESEPSMRMSVLFAVITVIGLVISLLRWPAFNWYIALAYTQTNDPNQFWNLSTILLAMNTFFGTFIGGIMATMCASIWFFIVSSAMLRAKDFPNWLGYFGILAGVFLILSIVNVFGLIPNGHIIQAFGALDAVWLLIFGVSLLIHKKAEL